MCFICEMSKEEDKDGNLVFTIYTTDGQRIVVKGKNLVDGWLNAEQALSKPISTTDVEWIDRGETDTHRFVAETGSWINRNVHLHVNRASIVIPKTTYIQ